MSDTVSIAHLTSRALIAVGGPEWQGFLQGLITQDVETMALGEVRFGALLTPQGRLLYDLFIVGREEGVWLDVEAEHRDAIIQRLMMYRLRAKVEISTSDTPVFAAFEPLPIAGYGKPTSPSLARNTPSFSSPIGGGGPREAGWRGPPSYSGQASGLAKVSAVAGPLHQTASGPPPPMGEEKGSDAGQTFHRNASGAPVAPSSQKGGFVVDPRLPELGWRTYGACEATADDTAYDAHRLALGIPGPADWGSDKTYPIEANFDLLNGIDFQKGCFIGQETTSRMKRRGVIKSRMLPITFDGPRPAHGAEVLAGDLRAGQVLSGADGRAIALMRLDRAVGANLTVDGRSVTLDTPAWFKAATA